MARERRFIETLICDRCKKEVDSLYNIEFTSPISNDRVQTEVCENCRTDFVYWLRGYDFNAIVRNKI